MRLDEVTPPPVRLAAGGGTGVTRSGFTWTVSLDIPSLGRDLTPNSAKGYVPVYDVDDALLRRVLLADILAGVGGGGGGSGDMLASIYDPNTVAGDAFAMGNMAEGADAKILTAAERTKLAGVAAGATANAPDATLLARANHTGTQSADTITDGTTNKAFTATEKTKLAGVASGATANSTDAALLARANHTGAQAISTVTGLQTALDGKVPIPTSGVFPVGTAAWLVKTANGTTVAGATLAGSSLATAIRPVSGTWAAGTTQTGTWTNISGVDMAQLDAGYWLRTA